jgi:hypothetical protein
MLSLNRKVEVTPLSGSKHRLQLTKRFHRRYAGPGGPDFATGRGIKHPERHLENSNGMDILKTAASHCQSPFHQGCVHPHLAIMPRMPWITKISRFPNMGVLLLSCITPNETIKGKATSCYSLALSMNLNRAATPLPAAIGSGVY